MPLQQLEAAGAWLGRLLLAAIFLHEAWAKLTAYDAAVGYMQAFGLPGWLLPFAIAVELVGGILVIAGLYTRVAALALALFCVATAVISPCSSISRANCCRMRTSSRPPVARFAIAAAKSASRSPKPR